MLKYATKRRLTLAVIGALLFICMVAAPLRRQYYTTYSPTASSGQVAINKTVIHIGLPFTWLTLSSDSNQSTNITSSMTARQMPKLFYDLGIWAALTVSIGLVMRMDDVILPPGPLPRIKV